MAKRTFKINTGYLPIKAHYFLYNGALAGVIPFLPVIANQLGISHASIGVIYAVLPFLSFIGKPLFGCVADNLHKLKPMLMLFLIIIMFSTMGINFIPPLNTKSSPMLNISSRILCSSSGTSLLIIYGQENYSCIYNITVGDSLKCSLWCAECATNQSMPILHNSSNEDICQNDSKWNNDVVAVQQIANNISKHNEHNQWEFQVTNMSFDHKYMDINCSKYASYNCNASCMPSVGHCHNEQKESMDPAFQFWTFFALAIAAYVSCGISVSLSDAACFNILKGKGHLYGRQRLWGTIGWGCFVALAGHLVREFSRNSPVADHAPGFYILFGLMFLDLVAVYYIKMENLKMSKSILRDVASLLVNPNVIAFITAVFMIGIFTSLLWCFLFLYLVKLEASDDLLGYVSGMQCIGELPFFFFSGWLISKIGHSQTLTITFISFGVRFIAYSYLNSPWWVLPIELLQGPTFGAFYTAMASYASIAAPPGTEVTMQGLVGGAFEGLGMSVGALLGGLVMEKRGGKDLFFWAGIVALISCCLHVLVNLLMSLRREKSLEENKEKDKSPNTEEITSFI